MKNLLFKNALLLLVLLTINSCKEENVKNTLPNTSEAVKGNSANNTSSTLSSETKNCSWCKNTFSEDFYLTVFEAKIAGVTKLIYTEGGRDSRSNAYDDFRFCSLNCLNGFVSSKLVNNKFEVVYDRLSGGPFEYEMMHTPDKGNPLMEAADKAK
jgi:hypothetical protein